MNQRNIFDFETNQGIKRLEIQHGDILQCQEQFDVLVVSAFQDDYQPIAGTLIGGLKNIGIDVARLAENPEYDLRSNQPIWLSRQLPEQLPFRRIACIELSPKENVSLQLKTIRKRLASLFGLLVGANYINCAVTKIMLSIIGANMQNYSAAEMVCLLFQEGGAALHNIGDLLELRIMEHDLHRFQELNKAFNELLGRNQYDIDVPVLYEATQENLKLMRQELRCMQPHKQGNFWIEQHLAELITAFDSIEQEPRCLIAFKCRRLAKLIAKDLLGDYAEGDLVHMINKVGERYALPSWEICYWHTIRTLGNECVHIKDIVEEHTELIYKHPTQEDINILLLCMAQIVKMWKELRK